MMSNKTKKDIGNLIDGHKVHLHPHKSAGWEELGDCYPIHVEIGATARCNQRCVFCALDFMNHKPRDIDTNVMLKALKDMGNPSMPYKNNNWYTTHFQILKLFLPN